MSRIARMATERSTFLLDETQIPTQWYNVIPDLPSPPPPPLHPGTRQPVGPDDLAPLFPMALIEQEVTDRVVRRHPGRGARRLPAVASLAAGPGPAAGAAGSTPRPRSSSSTRASARPARTSRTPPSRRPTTTTQEGIRRLTTETGAGQWGTALAFATEQYGMECEIWQVRSSYDQKPARRTMMEIYGATLHPSPSELTAGRTQHPRRASGQPPASSASPSPRPSRPPCPREDTRYSLGSVLNHVLLHQTVIGEEALRQLELAEVVPDVIVGCTGGGSNFGGLAFPFLREKLARRMDPMIRCVEPAACPSLTRGRVPLRLRRRHRHDPADEDAHLGSRLRP